MRPPIAAVALAACISGLSLAPPARAEDAPAAATPTAAEIAAMPVDALIARLAEATRAKDDATTTAVEDALAARGKDAEPAVQKADEAAKDAPLQVSLEYAARAIEKKAGASAIIDDARNEKDRKKADRLHALLVRCASRPAEFKWMTLDLANEGSGATRRAMLAAIRAAPEGTLEAVKAGKDADSRLAAVIAMEMRGGMAASGAIVAYAGKDPDPNVRGYALRASARSGGRELAPFFLSILQDPAEIELARVEAMNFFNHTGTKDDLPALKKCLDDPMNASVHDRLARAIEQIERREAAK